MYEFVDTLAGSAQGTSVSLQTVFNGVNIDKALTDDSGRFVTTAVGGRGILPRRINMTETPYRHGARERSQTYDVREIPVEFLIEDDTSEGLRERFERLNGILLGSKKKLEFTDENAHFIATLESGDMPPENSNSVEGTLLFICSDSAKIKSEHALEIGTSSKYHNIKGQTETPWTSKTIFQKSANRFYIKGSYGRNVTLNYDFIEGDVLEIDYDTRGVFLNGNDLAVSVSLQTDWFELPVGNVNLHASHETEMTYSERYY